MDLKSIKENLKQKFYANSQQTPLEMVLKTGKDVSREKRPGHRSLSFLSVSYNTSRPTHQTIKWRAKGH